MLTRTGAKAFAFASLAAAGLFTSQNAYAACAVVEETAIGPNVQIATFMARQQARQAIRRSAGSQAARRADYNNAACVPAAATGSRARCTVQASFCTAPPVPVPPQNPVQPVTPIQPVQPVLPQPPVAGGTCYSYRAKAIGNGADQAQNLAANALAGSLAKVGAQIGGPGVTTSPPACYYLDNGTNQVNCEITARLCR
ncbi:hypothetical protein [Salaquimonas pukyongi]|uniref:hypothetical protein n=1 Tax=Salaquimonas pukyongi TaxID=2712698 RepID=UPI00096BAAC8|nr:hypothetical protein [Salaquimonas pukyongi]